MIRSSRHLLQRFQIKPQAGFALISTFFMLTVLTSLLGAYLIISRIELATGKASKDSNTGFYSAEAGLNVRAEAIRSIFVGYNAPTGTSPTGTPCTAGHMGTGDFACQSYTLNNRTVQTYVQDHQSGGDPPMIRIPSGELYQNLNAQEYRYTANSEAKGNDGKTEAILQLRFKSRVVPMFQFVAFYNKDLEILPGPSMNLSGPIHVNGDLYMNCDNTLAISGQVTSSSRIYRGRKNDATCRGSSVTALNPSTQAQFIGTCPSRTLAASSHVTPFNGMIQYGVQSVTVPEPDLIDPTPGRLYWDKADLRVMLRVDASSNPISNVYNGLPISNGIEIRNADNSVNAPATRTLFESASCNGLVHRNDASSGTDMTTRAIGSSFRFRNNREGRNIRMLDVDMQGLLNCLRNTNWFGSGKSLADTTEGGLVLYFGFTGPQSTSSTSPYGVRITNGATLQSSVAGSPIVKGITVVTDQGFYLQGNYNSNNKIPASALVDTFNVLSQNFWESGNFKDTSTTMALTATQRNASTTTQNLAVMAGTDTTGGQEGTAGQGGAYNGGLENYPRFHENWTGFTYMYRGSFVSLNRPRRQSGTWVYGTPVYNAPNRNWDYDTSFNNASNLPPLSPRFVYLKQELFVRDFDQ